MTTSRTVLRRKDTASNSALYMSFDLGDKQWQISFGGDRFGVSRCTVAAGDTAAVADRLVKAAARFRIGDRAHVHSVYEAGRDGCDGSDDRRRVDAARPLEIVERRGEDGGDH